MRKKLLDIPIDDLGASQINFDPEEAEAKMREGSIVEFQVTDLSNTTPVETEIEVEKK